MGNRISQAVLEAALRKAGGVPAGAAQILDCARSTVTRRIAKSESLQRLCEELQEELVDVAEYNMALMVRNTKHRNHFNATKFILETKGAKRGYTKTVNLTAREPLPIQFTPGQEAMA